MLLGKSFRCFIICPLLEIKGKGQKGKHLLLFFLQLSDTSTDRGRSWWQR